MRLVNRTRGAVLAERVEVASSPGARMKGLLGRAALPDGDALVIDPCTSIHTLFMRFPIDVLFVDRRGGAVRAIERMAPWRATRLYLSARWVAELPAGTLARSGTREGDEVALED